MISERLERRGGIGTPISQMKLEEAWQWVTAWTLSRRQPQSHPSLAVCPCASYQPLCASASSFVQQEVPLQCLRRVFLMRTAVVNPGKMVMCSSSYKAPWCWRR